MKNKILIFIGVVAIAGAVFLGIKHPKNTSGAQTFSDTASTTATSTGAVTSVGATSGENATAVKQLTWTAFQSYLSFLKAHNITGLKSVSAQNSDTCNNPTKTTECYALMDGAYGVGNQFKQADFTHILFDSKQIILSTNFSIQQSDLARGLEREVIYFTRDSSGAPKILTYTTPFEMTYAMVNKSAPLATSTFDARLYQRVTDTDQDGLPDEVETCTYQGAPKDCVKTNPNKRDSLGDGWWDGIRIFIKPSTPAKTS